MSVGGHYTLRVKMVWYSVKSECPPNAKIARNAKQTGIARKRKWYGERKCATSIYIKYSSQVFSQVMLVTEARISDPSIEAVNILRFPPNSQWTMGTVTSTTDRRRDLFQFFQILKASYAVNYS